MPNKQEKMTIDKDYRESPITKSVEQRKEAQKTNSTLSNKEVCLWFLIVFTTLIGAVVGMAGATGCILFYIPYVLSRMFFGFVIGASISALIIRFTK